VQTALREELGVNTTCGQSTQFGLPNRPTDQQRLPADGDAQPVMTSAIMNAISLAGTDVQDRREKNWRWPPPASSCPTIMDLELFCQLTGLVRPKPVPAPRMESDPRRQFPEWITTPPGADWKYRFKRPRKPSKANAAVVVASVEARRRRS